MKDFIERGSKLYDAEELAWQQGDLLGIVSSQQSQRNLESELCSQESVSRKPSRFSGIMKPVLAGASIVLGAIAGVVYDNKIGSELVEDNIVYSAGNNSDFEFFDQKINFEDAPISIDTDGDRISVLNNRPGIDTVDLNTIGVLPPYNFNDDKNYKDLTLDEGVVSVKAKYANSETFDLYYQDFENDLQGNLLPATRRDQGYTYWDYGHDSDSGRIIINHENSAYLMSLSDLGADSVKSSPSVGENHVDPQVDGDNIIFREYYSEAIFLSDDEFSVTQKIIDKGTLESIVLDDNFVAYTLNNGSKTELWTYDIDASADKLISNDFNPVGEIDLSDGNISWLEVNDYKSEIHVHNLEHDKEVVFGEDYLSRRGLKLGGSILVWIQGELGGNEGSYFADIQGYDFNETNLTLEEVLPDYNLTEIQEEVNNQTSENITLNRTDIDALLQRIGELENETSDYELTLDYVAQLLIEIREEREAESQLLDDFQEDWSEGNQTMEDILDGLNESNQTLEAMRQESEANNETLYNLQQEWNATNQSLSNVSAAPEEEDMLSKYVLWVGTAAATLTVGGFLLQNRQLSALKRRALDPISELVGFDADYSNTLTLSKEVVGIDPQGNVVVHVHGDQYNTMMQAARESDVDAYFGGNDSTNQ